MPWWCSTTWRARCTPSCSPTHQPDAFDSAQAQLQESLLQRLRQPLTPRPGMDLSQPAGVEADFISSFSA
jgi:hypothetical protein